LRCGQNGTEMDRLSERIQDKYGTSAFRDAIGLVDIVAERPDRPYRCGRCAIG